MAVKPVTKGKAATVKQASTAVGNKGKSAQPAPTARALFQAYFVYKAGVHVKATASTTPDYTGELTAAEVTTIKDLVNKQITAFAAAHTKAAAK